MLTDAVPKNIRKFRELKNFTREEMASYMEMSSSGYAKIEQGMVDISVRKLEQIAKVLEVDVNQILQFNTNQIFIKKGKELLQVNHIDGHENAEENKTNDNIIYLKKLLQSLERENELLRELLKAKVK